MQATREGIGAAGAFVEFATGVQTGENNFDGGYLSSGCKPTGMPRPSSSTLTLPSVFSVTSICLQ
jgi:hypothetical protein